MAERYGSAEEAQAAYQDYLREDNAQAEADAAGKEAEGIAEEETMRGEKEALDALKDTVLPFVERAKISPEGWLGWTAEDAAYRMAEAQQDADWERVRHLVAALQIFANPKSYGTEGVPVKITDIAAAALQEIGVEP